MLARFKRNPFLHQGTTGEYGIGAIDTEHVESGTASRRQAREPWTVPSKMFLPHILPWVEQAYHLGRLRINAREIGTFVAVAAETGECEIRHLGWTAVLPRDDVIHLEPQFSEAFGKVAILTPEIRASPDQGFEPRFHAAITWPNVSTHT